MTVLRGASRDRWLAGGYVLPGVAKLAREGLSELVFRDFCSPPTYVYKCLDAGFDFPIQDGVSVPLWQAMSTLIVARVKHNDVDFWWIDLEGPDVVLIGRSSQSVLGHLLWTLLYQSAAPDDPTTLERVGHLATSAGFEHYGELWYRFEHEQDSEEVERWLSTLIDAK